MGDGDGAALGTTLGVEPSPVGEEPVLLLSMPLGDEESQGAPISGAVGD
jgi:hypothetical protein